MAETETQETTTPKEQVAKVVNEKVVSYVNDHVGAKKAEMEASAAVETVWYKKIGFYVAAGVGAAVLEVVNVYGAEVVNIIVDLISNLF